MPEFGFAGADRVGEATASWRCKPVATWHPKMAGFRRVFGEAAGDSVVGIDHHAARGEIDGAIRAAVGQGWIVNLTGRAGADVVIGATRGVDVSDRISADGHGARIQRIAPTGVRAPRRDPL